VGENDRFHCPAQQAWRSDFRPVAEWGANPEAWSRGFDALGATHLVWRTDRRPDGGPIARLAGRLEPVEENRSAVTYRILPEGSASKK
jgi:hypothetical protein